MSHPAQHFVECDGQRMPLHKAAKIKGVSYQTALYRFNRNLPYDAPVGKQLVEIDGEWVGLAEAAKHYGVSMGTASYRYSKGQPIDTKPKKTKDRKKPDRGTRATHIVEVDGEPMALYSACRLKGLGYASALRRLKTGGDWSVVMRVSCKGELHMYKGELQALAYIAEDIGITFGGMLRRIKGGKEMSEAGAFAPLNIPKPKKRKPKPKKRKPVVEANVEYYDRPSAMRGWGGI